MRVAEATLHSEREAAGVRPRRWWELVLECGHTVERPVSYRPATSRGRRRNLTDDDIKPAQHSAYCTQCPTRPAHNIAHLRLRAVPDLAARWVAGLRALLPGITLEGPAWRAGGFVDYYARTALALPVPGAGDVAGSLVDIAARAVARSRSRRRGDDLTPERLEAYADQVAADPATRAELSDALLALAQLGYVRQRPDQEGSRYEGQS
jgi:hypothetical protein